MNLTSEQEAVLKGGSGRVLARYMKWFVDWGQAMGAERLVPVTNVHCILRTPLLKGMSEDTLDVYIEEFRALCRHKVKCKTLTHAKTKCRTSAPSQLMEISSEDEKGISQKELDFQEELNRIAQEAGISTTWSCTPYLVGSVPAFGEICAWTESSAVVFANSILGARTTRHGMESSLAAAFLGWVPEFGVLLTENRKASIQVEVDADVGSKSDWGALGYFAGGIAGTEIPVFNGVDRIGPEEAKQLSATLPYAGQGTTMFHIAGVTPEAPSLDSVLEPGREIRRITFGEKERREAYGKMTTLGKGEAVDAVILGCPFSSLEELEEISHHLQKERIASGVRLIVCTSHDILDLASKAGYTDIIHQAGGTLMVDSCPGAMGKMRPQNVVSNSFKQAFYGRSALEARTGVADLDGCIKAAVKGTWIL